MDHRRELHFTVRVAGSAVGPARLAVRDVAEIATRLEQALKRVGQVLYGQESRGRGRKPRDIEQLCSLYLVSWEAGSAVAGFEVAEPPPQLSLFGYIGANSLKAFLEGLAALAQDAPDPPRPPTGFDTGVLEACENLAGVFDRRIDELTFSSPVLGSAEVVTFRPSTRERVRTLLRGPLEFGRASKVGRLEVINGHERLTGRLWEADGTLWRCSFKPEHLEMLPGAWLKTVTLVGDARINDRTQEGSLDVEAILVHGAEPAISFSVEGRFWQSATLEELAARQDIAPVNDLDELTASWPSNEVFEDALEELLRDRLARREAIKAD